MPVRGEMIRTLQDIQIGAPLAMQQRLARNAELDLHEIDLQYQVAISGTAGTTPGWGEVVIEFEWEFHYAPSQRDSELEIPHFWWGAYIPTGGPVAVQACVTEWEQDLDTDAITGAVVSLAALGAGEEFNGWAHLSFQGLALLREDFSDNADLEIGDDA